MAVAGVLILALGLVLLLAEAHVSLAGLLAGLGALSAAVGVALLIAAGGAGLLVAVPVSVTVAGAAAVTGLLVLPRVAAARRAPVQAGPQRLLGTLAVVRSWHGEQGQVQVEGGLWHARLTPAADRQDPPTAGQRVIIDQIRGLTLTVRPAEPWEVELP